MSRIDELIERLCPDGVEYRPLGEVGVLTRGKRFVRNDFVDRGVPCIHYGELYTHYGVWAKDSLSFVNDEIASKLRYAQPGDVVIVGAGETVEDIGIGVAWLGDEPVAVHDACYIFHQDVLNPVFVSYFLHAATYHEQIKRNISSSKISSISAKGLSMAKIPIPPMEVQQEIVRVLDSFAELEAELEARRRQYAYYRDTLLDFAGRGSVPYLKLGDLGTFTRGKRFTASDYVYDGIGSIHYGEIYTSYGISASKTFSRLPVSMRNSLRFARYGDVVIAATGENVEDLCKSVAWLGEEDVAVHDDCWIYTSSMNPRYVVHALLTADVAAQKKTLVSNGKVSRISGKNLASISIPVPSKEEQDRVVEVLDRFDALVNDISAGIPAEIEARRRQYAYYRDKLLSFEEKVA